MNVMNRTLAGAAVLLYSLGLDAQFDDVEIQVTPLGGSIHMLKGAGGNLGASVGDDGIVLIDDQYAPLTPKILAALAGIGDGPVRFVINTHYHGDHVGGNEKLGETGSVIVAHENIRARMSTEQFSKFLNDSTPPYPDGALPIVTFNDEVTIHLNGEPARIHHVAKAHTDGDSIVHFPASNVIHMGDIFFNGLYPFVDLDGGGSLQGMIAGADLGLELGNADTKYIAGHGPVATAEDLADYRDYLVRARDNVQALIDEGKSLAEVIEAGPTTEWDDTLGQVWITPEQFVTFIYNSLQGIGEYTAPE